MDKLFAAGAAAAAILVVGATAYYTFAPMGGGDRYAACRTTAIASGSSALGGPIELTREDGKRVTEAELFTSPALVYFGFTFCPDVCPLDLARNAASIAELRERGMSVPLYFVTIDPARDDPAKLAEFTSYFDDAVIGLTGSDEDISNAARAYRAYYAKNGKDEDYLMDHSTFTYLVGEDATVIEVFRRDIPPETLADQVACFLNA